MTDWHTPIYRLSERRPTEEDGRDLIPEITHWCRLPPEPE